MFNYESKIKGFLKGKKSYSLGLMVAFFITGGFSYAENIIVNEDKNTIENKFISKSEETEVMIFINGLFAKAKNKEIRNIFDFKLGDEEIKPPVEPPINPPINPEPPVEPPINPPVNPEPPVEPPINPPVNPEPPVEPPINPPVNPEPPVENTQNISINSTGTTGNLSALGTIEVGKELINKGDLSVISDIELTADRKYNKIVTGAFIDGGKFVNDGNITTSGALTKSNLKGEGFGIYQKSGETINNGKISIQGTGHDLDNDGESDIPGGVGIYAESGTVTNSETGLIEANPNNLIPAGIGMVTTSGATLINNGTIKGMYSSMWAVNPNSTAVNNGLIETERSGLTAGNGGKVINNGIIKAWIYENPENGVVAQPAFAMSAMSYDGEETIAINSKDGVVYGLVDVTGRAAKFINEGIVNGRVKISELGGIVENNGTITGVDEAPGEVIVNNGKFIQGANGKLDVDKFVGDLFLSGDYAKDNFENNIVLSKDNINIKEHDGDILSNSVMYTVNDSKTELNRKNFNEIISNSNFANYLENNYVDGDILRQELYNNLKLIDNADEFTRATNNIFGNDIYPNLKKQTFEMLRFNKNTLVNNVFNQPTSKELRVIGGADYKNIKADSSNLSGYKEDISSVFLGADKQINAKLRLGTIANIGTLNAKFDMDNAKREEIFGQLNMFSIYKNKNDVQLTNNLFFGLSSGDLKRDLRFGDVYGSQKGDLDNKWIGLNNILSKDYFVSSFFVKPRVEVNATYLMQDSISENGNYGLDVEKQNVWSVEAGAGIEVGKEFNLNSVKSTINAFGTYLHELANPYDSTSVKLNNISSDSVKVSKYDKDSYKDIGIKLELEKNGLTGYVEYKYLFDSEYLGTAGMIYKF